MTVHPDSSKAKCRNEEIFHYWSLLAGNGKTFIGGDWNRNTEKDNELQRPLIYTFPDIGRTSVGRQLKPYFSKKTPGIGFAQLFRNNRFFS